VFDPEWWVIVMMLITGAAALALMLYDKIIDILVVWWGYLFM
jgi:hypothetical protein